MNETAAVTTRMDDTASTNSLEAYLEVAVVLDSHEELYIHTDEACHEEKASTKCASTTIVVTNDITTTADSS